MAKALATLKTETAVGLVDFTAGPVPNCAPTGLVGVQWMRGSNGKFNVNVVSNADNPRVALTGAMTPYKLG
jgi:branched-chain amino acid transport system substrate-binding protein